MKKFLLFFVLCTATLNSFSQGTVNQTDAKGLKQGKWVSRYPNGTLKYEGAFEANKPVCQWKRYHENGKTKALMSYRPNSERVFASLFDEEGKLYAKGVFEGSLRDSTWNFYSGNLIVQTENYHSGQKEGRATGFDQNGKVIWEKEWKNNLLQGKSTDYYPSGSPKNVINYVAGKRNGPAQFYSDNGLKSMEGSYLNDLSDGVWKIYDLTGNIKYQIEYNKGEMLNGGLLDSLQIKEFKKYDRVRGKIPEPKLNESGLPDNQQ